ncbi:MAG: zinc-ribbon domain-containing protein, partial [Deltaproteobacteria bacterium]|nr:zinc-ribbon domain-containing protein [Deltaproteobacteria bacterium]
MNVTCASCQTQYEINTARVPPGGGFIRCKNCGERIRIAAPSEAAPSDAIPLSGSAPVSVATAETMPLPVVDAPAAPAPIPLSASTEFEVPTTTTAIPRELLAQARPEPPAPESVQPPQFLKDLPVAVDVKKSRKEEPKDLPTPVAAPAAVASQAKPKAPTAAATVPAASGAALDIDTTDLPTTPARMEVQKRPAPHAAVEPPSDLPAPDVEAPNLMDELAAPTAKVAAEPAAAATPVPAPVSAPAPTNRRRLALIGGAAGAVLVLAGLVFFTPWFGLRIIGGTDSDTPAKPPAPEVLPQAKGKDKASPTPAKEAPKTPEAVKPKPVVLSAANVDTLGYADLKTATVSLAKSAAAGDAAQQNLLSWALFRLAARFGDEEAAGLLADRAAAPQAVATLDSLGAAAALGAMVMAGKGPAARKLGERLQRTRLKESGRAAYVISLTFTRKPEQQRAMRQLDRAVRLSPDLTDAKLRLAELQLAAADSEEAVASLVQMATTAQDPATTLHAARVLLRAGQLAALELAT